MRRDYGIKDAAPVVMKKKTVAKKDDGPTYDTDVDAKKMLDWVTRDKSRDFLLSMTPAERLRFEAKEREEKRKAEEGDKPPADEEEDEDVDIDIVMPTAK